MRICGEYTCTGCGACIYVCKRQCIDFKKNSYGEIYAEVDKDNCINCQRCINICPQNQKVKGKYPIKAYAAWSKLRQIRNYAASGGIATEIYTKAIKNGDYIIGAKFNDDCSVALKMTNNISDIEEFKNSKYVFSNTENIYIEIEKCLKVGKKIVAIGLPCQIAAIKKLFSENDDLLLIDLVCHGTTPFNDLKEHIKKLEETKKQKINKISFRAPEFGTENFVFAAYNNLGKCIYSSGPEDGDLYQYGYHKMITYRENCYKCIYANAERISDITLSDYKALGTMKDCNYDEKNVSCILVNTKKGDKYINELVDDERLFVELRPTEEPIRGDKQLQHPATKSRTRKNFERMMMKGKNFEEAIYIAVKNEKRRRFIKRYIMKIFGK